MAATPLHLYFHPFSSICQKVLIALYENDTPFTPHIVDFGDPDSAAAFRRMWPMGRFPVLRDEARDHLIPESSIIIEYLAQHYPGPSQLVPSKEDAARQMRMRDRFFDLYVNVPMQKVVGNALRPAGNKDDFGVERAKADLAAAYGILESDPSSTPWAMGKTFGMADCAAAPALYYANLVLPFGDTHPRVGAYFSRLMERPSFARVLREAAPYRANFPL